MAAKDRRFGDLWHELHPTLQLGMQASTRKNKQKERKRDRERFDGGKRRDPGFRQVGTRSLRVATGTFARCFLPFGFSRVFLDRVWRKGRVTRTQLLVITTYQGLGIRVGHSQNVIYC